MAGSGTLFSGSFIKLLKSKLNFNNTAYILTGSDDPTLVAQDAPGGSLFLKTAATTVTTSDPGAAAFNSGVFGTFEAGNTFTATVTGPVTIGGATTLRNSSIAGNMYYKIYATAAGVPTTLLATSDPVVANSIPSGVPTEQLFTFSTPATLTSGVLYAATLVYPPGIAGEMNWFTSNPGHIAGYDLAYSQDGGSTWTQANTVSVSMYISQTTAGGLFVKSDAGSSTNWSGPVIGAGAIASDLNPSTDNAYSLGSTSFRWASLHTGPGSVVVHNDNTDTAWLKTKFNSSVGQLITDATTPLQVTTGTNAGVYINTSGQVGVGTISPTSPLYVKGSATTMQVLESSATATSLELKTTGGVTADWLFQSDANGANAFRIYDLANSIYGMTILGGSGNIGFGTETPTSKLSVGASSEFQVNTSGDIVKIKNLTYSWPASHTSNGFLQDNGSGTLSWVTVPTTLAALTDVNVTSPTPVQGANLQWDSGTSKWVAESVAAAVRTSLSGQRNYYSTLSAALAAAVTGDHILWRGSSNYTIGGGGVTIAGNFTLEFAPGTAGVIDASSGGNVNFGADIRTINVVVASNNSSGIIHFSGDRSYHIGLTNTNPFAGTTSTAFQIDAGVKNVTALCKFQSEGSGGVATTYLGYAAGDAASNNIVVTSESGSVYTTTDRNVAVKTTTYTAFNFDDIFANTSGGAFTITLPATPHAGWRVIISDYSGNWGTNNVTVARNGSNINGAATNFTLNINNAWAEFIYVDSTQGWRVGT